MRPEATCKYIKGRAPTTIALCLATLNAKKACDTIAALPEKIRVEVLVRLANLEKVDKRYLDEIESVIREQLENVGFIEGSRWWRGGSCKHL
jgi:flagellar motor switch protein FliG